MDVGDGEDAPSFQSSHTTTWEIRSQEGVTKNDWLPEKGLSHSWRENKKQIQVQGWQKSIGVCWLWNYSALKGLFFLFFYISMMLQPQTSMWFTQITWYQHTVVYNCELKGKWHLLFSNKQKPAKWFAFNPIHPISSHGHFVKHGSGWITMSGNFPSAKLDGFDHTSGEIKPHLSHLSWFVTKKSQSKHLKFVVAALKINVKKTTQYHRRFPKL